MLKITIPGGELFDEQKQEFIYTKDQTIALEHSLVSLYKWESKWHKPFLSTKDKTVEEYIDYIRCMTITQNIDPNVYNRVTKEILEEVSRYMEEPMTATTFSNTKQGKGSNKIITAEELYYSMITLGIPFECQKWHLNKLMTLIRVCNIKNAPKKKMSQREIMQRNKSINAERRKRLGSKG